MKFRLIASFATVDIRTGEAATDLPVEAYPAWEDSTTIPIIDEKAREMGCLTWIGGRHYHPFSGLS